MATDANVAAVSKDDRSSSSSESKTEKSSGSSLALKSVPGGDPKLCGVCGDKALGNNFNAITCESCKAFFRRNALRAKEFVCPFSNNCKVNAVTRRFCQKCRLKKCFDIGMKKEWIMTDEEKKIKKQKIEQNRKKRTSLENSGGARETSSDIDDGETDDVASTPNKYDPESPESEMLQRLTGPVLAAVTSGIVTDGGGGGANHVLEDNGSNVTNGRDARTSKTQKPLMGLQTNIENSQQKCLDDVIFQKENRERSNIEAALQISSPSPSCKAASPPHSPPILSVGPQNHSITPAAVPSPNAYPQSNELYQQNNLYYQRAQQNSHSQQVLPSVTPSWAEGDSSNSTPSPSSTTSTHPYSQIHHHEPPPLIKYPPNKRPRMFEHNGDQTEDQSASNNQSNPLLSFLIQPNNSESSPDHATSPPATHPVQSVQGQTNYVEDESHNQFNSTSYIPPQQMARHHPPYNTQYREYQQDDYDRSPPTPRSPSVVSTYQNGYQQPSRYSLQSPYPAAAVDLDNHAHNHDHNHYRDSQLHLDQNQTVRIPPMHTMDSILSIAIAAEFNSFGMLGGNNPNSKELNKAEQAKLNELLVASQALNAPVDADRPIPKESESSDTSLLNVINLTEIAIRRLIKMSKRISGFKNMCQEDQIALLKGGCTEMMILRSAVTYDPDRDSWQIPHSNPGYNINLGVLKAARGNLYEEHQRFNKTFRSEWRKDENIMIILCAITLFTPERPNVIHRDVVKLEQDSYYYLLKRYMESVMNGCEAKSNYLQLIRKIAELRALNSSHVRVFLEMNPKEVEPLLIEIFDLK